MQADFRTRADGVIEYRHQQGFGTRRGYWEQWEPVAIHAARNMLIPEPYLSGLREAGYEGGSHLLDLLNAEGWLVEKQSYLELAPPPVLEAGSKPIDPATAHRLAEGTGIPVEGRE